MTATISRLFDNYNAALQAVRDLETAGVPQAEISIVASNADGWYATEPGTSAPEERRRRALFGPSPRDHVVLTPFRKRTLREIWE